MTEHKLVGAVMEAEISVMMIMVQDDVFDDNDQLQLLGDGYQDASEDGTDVRQHSEVPETDVAGWLVKI